MRRVSAVTLTQKDGVRAPGAPAQRVNIRQFGVVDPAKRGLAIREGQDHRHIRQCRRAVQHRGLFAGRNDAATIGGKRRARLFAVGGKGLGVCDGQSSISIDHGLVSVRGVRPG